MVVSPQPQNLRLVQAKAVLLLVLCLASLLTTALRTAPGYVSIDELIYHQMALSMASEGSLTIWNGYSERPSEELSHHTLQERDGRLYPRYPWLNAVVGALFHSLAGLEGLYWPNALGWLLAVACCFGIARQLLGSVGPALDACLILSLTGFGWSYSQAIWPHASSMGAVSLAMYCGLRGSLASKESEAWLWSGVAGLVTGLAMGLRLDCMLVLPGLLVLHLARRPLMMRRLAAIAVGLLPGLLSLSWSNCVKFGSFSFLHYGHSKLSLEFTTHAALAGVAVLLWVAWKWPSLKLHGRDLLDLLVLAVLAWLLLNGDPVRNVELAFQRLRSNIFDLRYSGLQLASGMQRTVTGGMVYLGGLKKSTLQSLPYLPALLLPLVHAWRNKEQRAPLLGLLAVPACFALVPYSRFHCGQALNTRYLVSGLPCLAVVLSWTLQWLGARVEGARLWKWLSLLASVAAVVVFFVCLQPWHASSPREQEPLLLSLPMWGAAGLSGLCLLSLLFRQRLWAGLSLMVLMFSLAWSGVVGFCYDYPREHARRVANAELTAQISAHIEPDALVFTNYIEPLGPLTGRKLRLARPFTDDFRDFRQLALFHLRKGRAVYGAFHPLNWKRYAGRGLLRDFEVIELVDIRQPRLRLARLERKRD